MRCCFCWRRCAQASESIVFAATRSCGAGDPVCNLTGSSREQSPAVGNLAELDCCCVVYVDNVYARVLDRRASCRPRALPHGAILRPRRDVRPAPCRRGALSELSLGCNPQCTVVAHVLELRARRRVAAMISAPHSTRWPFSSRWAFVKVSTYKGERHKKHTS